MVACIGVKPAKLALHNPGMNICLHTHGQRKIKCKQVKVHFLSEFY